MQNPLVAILAAAVAGWVFGAVWYMALGKAWQAALGRDPTGCKGQKMPAGPMVGSFLAELVMAAVLSQVLQHMSVVGWQWGALSGLEIGIGLMATTTVVNNLFPGRKPMLSVIDGAHWIGVAVIQCTIIGTLA
jgi:hypothetical protein